MNELLKDKIALVTGGTRGIGAGIVRAFINQGATVIFWGTNAKIGKALEEELIGQLESDEPKVFFEKIDVTSTEQVNDSIAGIEKKFGRLDILVNNAGITRDALLMRLTEEAWDQVMDVNLKSVYRTCKAAIRNMMKKRFGKIINITSIVGIMGEAGQTNYAASKAGIIAFTKSLGKEVGARGITVNCIAPGYTQTDMTAALSEEQTKHWISAIPLGRAGTPNDIAGVAVFLASPLADYITRQVITVDGGAI
ncbi:3-oxoacyl-ACP reductase FabG [Candidatus Clavichlamydia salmonicola]|uniref:3-oxoacyl-ACP reductase FabG n=1 Tax=Candidatus Clavichlamydia salmonicola TaxID=469812 RepID=UPI0018919C58|nr:3-oxoacyl-ACP reductase FabG [Candidatus Clavichlamydia salmonicola]